MQHLRQVSIIGMGLLGSSVSLAVLRSVPGVQTVGFSHRALTRRKAGRLGVATRIEHDIRDCVAGADMVILATPICTFERIFGEIADFLKPGCIVTDVGSTKALPHRWARRLLPKDVFYVGSHPVAGSEQRGVEFARDDLLEDANCILTATANTSKWAVGRLTELWSKLGCTVTVMTPQEHDRVLANVSHLPHIVAAALVNMTVSNELGFAGKGFSDATRIASSPANIWVDILLTNPKNVGRAVDRLIRQLLVMRRALGTADGKRITRLLNQARSKRARLIKHQMSREVGS